MLNPPLTDMEVRVLGSLIEKEVTTPDNYPLSLSSLGAACNQSSNREPVMQLDEDAVMQAVASLRRRNLVRAIQPSGSRVMKYAQLLRDALELDARALAVLDVLMLRGPQTAGELNARTGRLAEFADLGQMEATLEGLSSREPEPLVVRLPRRSGQKEVRWAHLLSGAVAYNDDTDEARGVTHVPALRAGEADDRVATLERMVESLRSEVSSLRAQFEEFRAQFQ